MGAPPLRPETPGGGATRRNSTSQIETLNELQNHRTMKPRIILLCLGLLLTARAAQAQWVVTDPTNLAQGIINSTKQIVEAARNGSTLLQSFQETVKIYEQGV